MNVQIFNVLNKNGMSFADELGRQWLVNTSKVSNVVAKSLTTSQLTFLPDARWPASPQSWVVDGDVASINQSLSGAYNAANISLSPSFINGKPVSGSQSINVDDISYAVADGGNILVFVIVVGHMDLAKWQFNSTTLTQFAQTVNSATSNQVLSATFGACTTTTQAATFSINQAGNILLEAFNGSAFVTIDSDPVTAASTSNTFSFPPGDLVFGQAMRITLQVGSQYLPIATGIYSCAGGSGSGSGASGDCNMYAYFDGVAWNNTLNTLNWGATCSFGYNIQVSRSSDFTDEGAYIINTATEVTLLPLTLTPGTYYARVRNISGQMRYSPTLTFVAS